MNVDELIRVLIDAWGFNVPFPSIRTTNNIRRGRCINQLHRKDRSGCSVRLHGHVRDGHLKTVDAETGKVEFVPQFPRLCLADRVLALERPRQLHRLTHRLAERQRSAEALQPPTTHHTDPNFLYIIYIRTNSHRVTATCAVWRSGGVVRRTNDVMAQWDG